MQSPFQIIRERLSVTFFCAGQLRIQLGLSPARNGTGLVLLELHCNVGAWRHVSRALRHKNRLRRSQLGTGADNPLHPHCLQVQLLFAHLHQACAGIGRGKYFLMDNGKPVSVKFVGWLDTSISIAARWKLCLYIINYANLLQVNIENSAACKTSDANLGGVECWKGFYRYNFFVEQWLRR